MLGYVKCKKWEHYGEIAIPLRGEGDRALFTLPYVKNEDPTKPKMVYLTRDEIYI